MLCLFMVSSEEPKELKPHFTELAFRKSAGQTSYDTLVLSIRATTNDSFDYFLN